MTNPSREVLSSAFFAAALALTGSHVALGATNYNAYIKGTFEAINYDNTHESDLVFASTGSIDYETNNSVGPGDGHRQIFGFLCEPWRD
jgi:hypothetical protein